MADFLTIGSVTVKVVANRPREGSPEPIGARGRAASGRDAGWVRAEKRQWGPFTTYDLTQVEWDALRAECPPGVAVTCDGDALGGPVSCVVTRSATAEGDSTHLSHVWVATLSLSEA